MKTLVLFCLLCCISFPVDAQDRILEGAYWYGDSANVHHTENVRYVDSASADITPYARIQFHCQYNNIDSLGVWCSIPARTQIALTVEHLTNTIEVIGRLTGPLPYGRYAIAFQNPRNEQIRFASIEATVVMDGTEDWNNGIAFIDAAFVTLSTMDVSYPNDPVVKECLTPQIFIDINSRAALPSHFYKPLGNGRALVR
jgi:hypothetical protein